jgi:hypothetical protein
MNMSFKENLMKRFLTALTAAFTFAAAPLSAETLTMSSWVPPTHFVHTDILAPFAKKVSEVT